MNDFARHLPLSQRKPEDESAVTSDWRPMIGECLGLVTDLLAALPLHEWERTSLRDGWRVHDVAGHLVWRIGSTNSDLIRSGVRAVLREGVSPLSLVDAMTRRAASASPDELVRQLRVIADARTTHHGRHGVGDLGAVVLHGYDIAHAIGRRLAFPSVATGAVALARSLSAPTPIKAVIRDRTLTATDAGWSIGHGPELAAPAEELILFLFGRSRTVPSTE